MAKKIQAMVKLQIPAGKATPAPPVGTALGPHGVNIMDFVKAFNAKTAKDDGLIIPAVVTIYSDRSYTFITKTPPASVLLKRAANLAKGMSTRDRAGDYVRFALTDDYVSPRALPGQEGGIHTVTGLEHTEAGRPKDTPEVHIQMTEKRHRKLDSAVRHPELTIAKRFGDEGKVDVGILAWGSTFGEALEAMLEARREGIRCAAMKVVMLSPLPVDARSWYPNSIIRASSPTS